MDEIFALIPGLGVTALIAALISLCVSLTRYLFSSRLKNFSIACEHGVIDEKKKTQIEEKIYISILAHLEKMDRPFIEKFTNTNTLHKLIYITGAMTSILTIFMIALLGISEGALDLLTMLSAEVAIAWGYSLKDSLNDSLQILVFILIVAGTVTTFGIIILSLIQRVRCVWSIWKNETPTEPEKIEKGNVFMVCVGVLGPLSVLIVLVTVGHYSAMYEKYMDDIASVCVKSKASGYVSIETDFLEKFPSIDKMSDAKSRLVAAAIIDWVLLNNSFVDEKKLTPKVKNYFSSKEAGIASSDPSEFREIENIAVIFENFDPDLLSDQFSKGYYKKYKNSEPVLFLLQHALSE